jgi:hypothetical protein
LTSAAGRRLWDDLASPDAAQAFRSVRRLVAASDAAVALLRGNLRPRPVPDPEAIGRLLHDVESPQLAVRQQALAALAAVADGIAPVLREAVAKPGSLELKRRLAPLVASLDGPPPPRLRELRALEVLERVATPEAVQILEALAGGPETAQLPRDAAAVRDRLRR